jgi:inner membrane protein
VPTILSHPAVALGIAPWFRRLPAALVATAAILTSIPDADVLMFSFGVPYEHPLGHRGVTHSIAFAVVLAAVAAVVFLRFSRVALSFPTVFAFLFLSVVSHGVLDAMTNGGRGIGFFIPFSSGRFFLPIRPIIVSPIGAADFAERAGPVLVSEVQWVWLPAAASAGAALLLRRRESRA